MLSQNTINDKLVCKLMCCIKLTILKLIIFSLTTDPDVLHSSYTTAICCLLKNAYLHPCPVEVVMSCNYCFWVFFLIALTMLFLSTAVVFLVLSISNCFTNLSNSCAVAPVTENQSTLSDRSQRRIQQCCGINSSIQTMNSISKGSSRKMHCFVYVKY